MKTELMFEEAKARQQMEAEEKTEQAKKGHRKTNSMY